jgi:hypothetical protein
MREAPGSQGAAQVTQNSQQGAQQPSRVRGTYTETSEMCDTRAEHENREHCILDTTSNKEGNNAEGVCECAGFLCESASCIGHTYIQQGQLITYIIVELPHKVAHSN